MKGETIVLDIGDLNRDGAGVGRRQGMVVFVPGALPGERVRAVVRTVRKNRLIADLAEVLTASPDRVRPACPSGGCGGCQLLHYAYGAQLRQKSRWVKDSLERIGGLTAPPVAPTLGMDDPRHYRNKVRLHVRRRDSRVFLGFYARGSRVQESDLRTTGGCLLLREDLNTLARTVERLLQAYRVEPYDPAAGAGLLHHVTLREAAGTGETMVLFETAAAPWPAAHALARELVERENVTSVLQAVNNRPDLPPTDTRGITALAGRPWITDRLDGLTLRLSATAFSQVNPAQTAALYARVRGYAALTGRELVVDAYCGAGSIALYLARFARRVVGLEVVPAAVEDARENAALNGLMNVSFRAGAVEDLLPRLLAEGPAPDLVILDPPRRGCHPLVLEALAAHRIPRLVYVSCDPGTLARDLGLLARRGYRLTAVQPVDMFPHTVHVETCSLLVIGSAGG